MSETTKRSAYDKLSPQRKQLADMLVTNLDSGGLWKQGWRTRGAPENAVTGKKYRGVNNLYLFLVAMERGYSDNRWLTFNQMKARDWSFKTDAEGKSLGKNAGVSVEFFDLWDRDTHEKFDRSVLDGMSADERQAYMDENVYPIRRYYTVFNADLIDGIPEKEVSALDESARKDDRRKDAYVCSTYRKKKKHLCTEHAIKADVLKQIVLNDIRKVCAYVKEYEQAFIEDYRKCSVKESARQQAAARNELKKAESRLSEIGKIIVKLYEEKVCGTMPEARFELLAKNYEIEQSALK